MQTKKQKISDKLSEIDLSKPKTNFENLFSKKKEGTTLLDNALYIDISLIVPNPNQPRQHFKQSSLEELAESIKERGVLQPIRVRPSGNEYVIITGERRWKASKIAGLTEMPCIVVNQEDNEVYIDALIENIQREDLNPIDRANGLSELRKNLNLATWEAVGKKIGISKRHVYNLLGLKSLPEHIQRDIQEGILTEKHGRALKKIINDESKFEDAYTKIKADNLSGDEALALVDQLKKEKIPDVSKDFNLLKMTLQKSKDKLLVTDIQNLNEEQKTDLKKLLLEIEEIILVSKEKL
jgi:ParB family chromosome partitioning protein